MPIVKMLQSNLVTFKVPDGKARIEFVDADTPGLYLLVTSNGKAKSFFLRVRINGELKHFLICRLAPDTSLAEVRRLAAQKRAEVLQQGSNAVVVEKPVQAELTFTDFFNDHYLPYVKPRKRSWQRDEELFRLRLQAEFGQKVLSQITRQQIQLFHTQLLEKGLAPATCDHHVKLLKHALNLAIDWNLLTEKNPAARIPLFNVDNRIQHSLEADDLEKLLNLLRTDKNRTVCRIALFLMSTGCRLNEALQAKWSQIDKQNCVWQIPACNSKSKRIRSVPLNDSAMGIINELDTENRFEFLFVNEKTKQAYTTIMKVWSRLRAQIGLTLRLHDLRHFYASRLVSLSVPIYSVKKLLGHVNIATTERYSWLSNEALAKASKTIDGILISAKHEETA